MIDKPLLASLTRISDLDRRPFEIQKLEKAEWDTGDYVVGIVTRRGNAAVPVELASGRLTEPMLGDHVVGALGIRAATLEVTGDWQSIGPDQEMHALTAAGLMGKTTSASTFVPTPLPLSYCGHCVRDGRKLAMRDFVDMSTSLPSFASYDRPTILLIGTSMSSGKTTSAKVMVRQLVRAGMRVAGVKLTGAGRLRDTLAMQDAGAEMILDFVDAGLPSTVCSAAEYENALQHLLAKIMAGQPDVVVAEAGASPLEPYNGDSLIQAIQPQVRCTVLCASDPYAVLGVTKGFGFEPDFVAGLATSTQAGVAVIEKLAHTPALNLLDPASGAELSRILETKLGSAMKRKTHSSARSTPPAQPDT